MPFESSFKYMVIYTDLKIIFEIFFQNDEKTIQKMRPFYFVLTWYQKRLRMAYACKLDFVMLQGISFENFYNSDAGCLSITR